MTHIIPRVFINSTLSLGRASTVSVTSVRHNYTHIEHARSSRDKLSYRVLPHPREKAAPEPKVELPSNFRFVYPDFLPTTNLETRNKLKERLERYDMISRRKHIDIPEFYVGTIMATVVHDQYATGKSSRFVGICIKRGGSGLRAWFALRNIIDNQGVEITYEMYCPLIKSVEVLRLEKRLDDELHYLRDALPEYSTFSQDMEAELIAEGAPVPVNDIKVKMVDDLWHTFWERHNMKGIEFGDELTEERQIKAEKLRQPDCVKYDLMAEYRATIPEEEQEAIFRDMAPHYPALRAAQRKTRKRKLAGAS